MGWFKIQRLILMSPELGLAVGVVIDHAMVRHVRDARLNLAERGARGRVANGCHGRRPSEPLAPFIQGTERLGWIAIQGEALLVVLADDDGARRVFTTARRAGLAERLELPQEARYDQLRRHATEVGW